MQQVPCGVVLALLFLTACDRQAPDKMSFFVTSVPAGDGGSIGGLQGADAHCQKLARERGDLSFDFSIEVADNRKAGTPSGQDASSSSLMALRGR